MKKMEFHIQPTIAFLLAMFVLSARGTQAENLQFHSSKANETNLIFVDEVVDKDGTSQVYGVTLEGELFRWDKSHPEKIADSTKIGQHARTAYYSRLRNQLYIASIKKLLTNKELVTNLETVKWETVRKQDIHIPDFAFSADEKTLVSGLGFRNFSPFKETTEGGRFLIEDFESGQQLVQIETEKPVMKVAVSPNGELFAYAESGGFVVILNRQGKELGRVEADAMDLEFSPDNQKLCIAGEAIEGLVLLWDVQASKVVRSVKSPRNYSVLTCRFSPDGRFLAVGGQVPQLFTYRALGRVTVYETKELKEVAAFTDHDIPSLKSRHNRIYSLNFSLDGKSVISGNAAGNVKFWDISKIVSE